MLRVGLTGGIGAGKSAVAQLLADRGAAITDADVLAREVIAPDTEGLAEVVAAFGAGVLRSDGSLDRAALGSVVFSDPDALQQLNAITHPRIGVRTRKLFAEAEASGARVWVHDVPLLVENDMAGSYDEVVVVEAPKDIRIERLVRRGVPEVDARSRMANQASDEQRRVVATYVIDNGGQRAELERQVSAMWTKLLAAQPQRD